MAMFDANKVHLGIAPIGWCNDDMPELGAENTFRQTVSEMALAGFTGCEIGNKYPSDPKELKWELDLRGMRIASRPSGIIVNYGGLSFIYSNGVFYNSIGREFEVVRPRVGMIVPSLPMGHTVMMRKGAKHYIHNGVIYSPMHRNGRVVFRIVGFI